MTIISAGGAVVGAGGAAAPYEIERSLRFNSADSAYLNRTPASAGNRRTWTWSGWVKLGVIGSNYSFFYGDISGTGGDGAETSIQVLSTGKIELYIRGGQEWATTPIFRDPSAWYHIVWAVDTTQANNTDRQKLYVNGVQITSFSTQKTITQNFETGVNNTQPQYIGSYGAYVFFNGYQTEVHLIDGQQLDATSFGEFNSDTGVWQPIEYTGTYGTNGFYLNFSDNASTTTLGDDFSGNNNDWTTNNFSVTAGAGNDSLVDSPTRYGTDTGAGGEVRGNYATWNALVNNSTLTNGNLQIAGKGSSVFYGSVATTGITSGKWYWEITNNSNTDGMTGIIEASQAYAFAGATPAGTTYVGYQSRGYAYHANGNKYNNATSAAYGATYTTNDVIGVAFDADAGTLVFYKNGVSQGTAYTVSAGYTWFPADNVYQSDVKSVNFGQRPFAYTAPSGFKALVTTNLPTPTIEDGGDYFNTVLWTGNGSTQNITGVGFQPDFVWVKARSIGYWNRLYDAVRGFTKELYSNATDAESTETNTITAVSSDGFSLGNAAGVNGNTQTFVAWNWKANGAGSTNTAGNITSTVSVNTTSGFSIVTYTGTGTSGRTVGHGLGVTPAMIIVKSRSAATGWMVWQQSLTGIGYNLYLQGTDSQQNDNQFTSVSSTTFGIHASGGSTNASGATYVAYCFAEVPGFSSMKSYVGNGSADGTFVYTGFRPRFVLVKRSSAAGDPWQINDTARNPSNLANLALHPNASDSEYTYGSAVMDILSNGFKLRGSDAYVNASGSTYIYTCFAENPFAYALAR